MIRPTPPGAEPPSALMIVGKQDRAPFESDETPSFLASAQYVGVTRGGMDGGRPVAHMSGTLGCPSSLKQGARNRRCCVYWSKPTTLDIVRAS